MTRTCFASGLPHEVYVWQRVWTEPVRRAVAERGPAFTRVVALNAEVTWQQEKPHLIEVPIDYQVLAATGRPIGLALRVGPYSGPFASTNPATAFLATLAKSLVDKAAAAGVLPSELQLDFDCATIRLDGYRAWVEAIREKIAPVPVVITALPTWLETPAFKALAEAAGAYVLQVHSLERPTDFDTTFTLCDPALARRSVSRAASMGVPFRVALPTYGYLVAFNGKGKFVGISAEGPAKRWPANVLTKEVRANPLELAQLVKDWTTDSPASLKGIIWYRLPVSSDILNWRWPTLSAILDARIPRKGVRAESHRVEPGLAEIRLVNDGELDISSRLKVHTRWRGARLLAGDGLHGFELADERVFSAKFETGKRTYHLPPGETQVVGWLRLTEDCEVEIELEETGTH